MNNPDQEVTETGVFRAGVRPTKCFGGHGGSVFNTGKGSGAVLPPASPLCLGGGTVSASLPVQVLLKSTEACEVPVPEKAPPTAQQCHREPPEVGTLLRGTPSLPAH